MIRHEKHNQRSSPSSPEKQNTLEEGSQVEPSFWVLTNGLKFGIIYLSGTSVLTRISEVFR
jgi:hypothetical protein